MRDDGIEDDTAGPAGASADTAGAADGGREGAEPRRVPRWRRVAAIALISLGGLTVAAVVAGFLIHVPYVIISPGMATPIDRAVVTIEGAPTYDGGANVLYLTVRVSNHDPSVWRYVVASLDSDQDVVARESVVGCLSDADNRTYNTGLMTQSQGDATKVALERLGYAVTTSAVRLIIVQACKGVPAYGHLRVGDQIVAVDDAPLVDLPAVRSAIDALTPGTDASVTVVREGVTTTLSVPVGREASDGSCRSAQADERGADSLRPCLGILIQQFVEYQFPLDVTFHLSDVGGPSAGLAFSLAIVDDLTPGDLTGGKRVSVTGAITADGGVVPVGGVEQKAITARHNGVDLMIVPRSELAAARKGAGDVQVVGVRTLDEALAALQRVGGAPVPPPTTTAARS